MCILHLIPRQGKYPLEGVSIVEVEVEIKIKEDYLYMYIYSRDR